MHARHLSDSPPTPALQSACFEALESRRLMSAGLLEPQFSTDGMAHVDFGIGDVARSVTIQRDNKIILTGGLSASSDDFAVARLNPDGSIDSSFGGGDGKVTIDFGGTDTAVDAAIDSKGRIIVVGHTTVTSGPAGRDVAVVRLDAQGNIDTSFGPNGTGKVTIDFGLSDDVAAAVAIRPDGKILIAGTADRLLSSPDVSMIRLNGDGTADTTFSPVGWRNKSLPNNEYAADLALSSSGKFFIVGTVNGTSSGLDKPIVLKFNEDGSDDTSFGTGGHVILESLPGRALGRAIALDSQNRIVVGATTNVNNNDDFAAVRLTANGSLDFSFGSGGTWVDNTAGIQQLDAMIVQPDDKVLLGGHRFFNNSYNATSMRLTVSGTLDSSYAHTGRNFLIRPGDQRVHAIAQADDGSIILAGADQGDMLAVRYRGMFDIGFGEGGRAHQFHDVAGSGPGDEVNAIVQLPGGRYLGAGKSRISSIGQATRLALFRWNADGSYDRNIGLSGFVDGETEGSATDLVVQSDGKVVVVGSSQVGLATSKFGVARLLLNGDIDSSFATNGRRTIEIASIGSGMAQAVALDGQGRIVIAGYQAAGDSDASSMALARLQPDGSLDPTFGANGVLQLVFDQINVANDVIVQGDGKIVVAGTVGSAAGGRSAVIVRLNESGQLDTTFGSGGIQAAPMTGPSDGAAVRMDAQGRYVLGAASGPDMVIARLLPSGAVDSGFANGRGYSRQGFDEGELVLRGMTIQYDGKIVATGYGVSGAMAGNILMMRWNGDGTADTTFAPIHGGGSGAIINYDLVGRWDRANDVISTDDGDLLIAGRSGPSGTTGTPLLLKYAQPNAVVHSEFRVDKLQRVSVKFNENVGASVQTADFELRNLTTNQYIPADKMSVSYDADRNTATLTFPGFANGALPDGDYRLEIPEGEVMDTAGNAVGSHELDFFVLAGDANRDRVVNLRDFNILAGNFGQDLRTWFHGDFNYDGIVNLRDFNILAGNFGKSLDQPAATAGAAQLPLPRPGGSLFSSTTIDDDLPALL